MRFVLIFLMMGFCVSAQANGNGAERLQAFVSNVSFFKADFSQKVYDEDGTILQSSKGVLKIARPGKFRWEIKKPLAQLLVSDGDEVKVYEKDLMQMSVRPLAVALKNTPLGLLMGQGDIGKEFYVTELGEQSGYEWIELRPRNSASDFDRVSIAFKGNTPVIMDLKDTLGQSTQVQFSKVNTQAHSLSIYRFTPPTGVDVVRYN